MSCVPPGVRYVIAVHQPDAKALSYGIDWPIHQVIDVARYRKVPFGNYSNRAHAIARIKRESGKT